MQHWLVALQVIFTLLHCLAVACACFRLYRRKIIGQIYWDDYAAAIALALELAYFPTLWFPNNFPTIMDIDPMTNRKEVMIQIVNSWFVHAVWILLVWTTRISLGLSITRVLPNRTRFYYASWGIVVALVVITIVIVATSAIDCAMSYPGWSITPPFQCYVGSAPYIAYTVMDVIADLLLVVVPLWAFWRETRLLPSSRRIIKIGFAVNVMAAFASLIIGVTLLVSAAQDHGMVVRITTHIMCVVSILACNSLVVVTSIYRRCRTKVSDSPRHNPQQQQQPPSVAQTAAPTTTNHTTPAVDESRQSLTSQESLHLTLTVVRTDPSLIPYTQEQSQSIAHAP